MSPVADSSGSDPERGSSEPPPLISDHIAIGAALAVVVGSIFFGVTPEHRILDRVVEIVGLQGLILSGTAVLILRLLGDSVTSVPLARPSRREWALLGGWTVLVSGGVATAAYSYAIGSPVFNPGPIVWYTDPTYYLVLAVLSVVLVGPAEEFLFRGVLLSRVATPRLPTSVANIAVSLAFAFLHIPGHADDIGSIGFLFVGSLLLGIVMKRTDNTMIPILIHAIYNAGLFSFFWYVAAT